MARSATFKEVQKKKIRLNHMGKKHLPRFLKNIFYKEGSYKRATHPTTRHIWLKKLAHLYFKRKVNFSQPKFLFLLFFCNIIRKRNKNFRYADTLSEISKKQTFSFFIFEPFWNFFGKKGPTQKHPVQSSMNSPVRFRFERMHHLRWTVCQDSILASIRWI